MTTHVYYAGPVPAVWRHGHAPPPPKWVGLMDHADLGLVVGARVDGGWYYRVDDEDCGALVECFAPLRWLQLDAGDAGSGDA